MFVPCRRKTISIWLLTSLLTWWTVLFLLCALRNSAKALLAHRGLPCRTPSDSHSNELPHLSIVLRKHHTIVPYGVILRENTQVRMLFLLLLKERTWEHRILPCLLLITKHSTNQLSEGQFICLHRILQESIASQLATPCMVDGNLHGCRSRGSLLTVIQTEEGRINNVKVVYIQQQDRNLWCCRL